MISGKERKERAKALFVSGKSLEEVKSETGLSEGTLKKYRNDANNEAAYGESISDTEWFKRFSEEWTLETKRILREYGGKL